MTVTCPRCGASMPASFKFCSNCGQRLQESESDRIGESAPGDALPRPAERRQITVMFCDLVGSVELSNQLDPEDLREIIRRYQEAATRVVEKWEGYVAQYLGDGILVYFGYPVAHEGEAERAIRAGTEILKEVRSLGRKIREESGVEIAVRLGLHTGLVVVGEVGSGQRRENLALGETPNLAARLQSIAPPNGIVISEATHRLISGTFECMDLGPQAIKGLPREERVYQVKEERLEASPLDVHGRRGPIRARGRETELESFSADSPRTSENCRFSF
ncbi:MAG: adenylate/guanylate cyclase domain-containing protein [Rhodothermales bacterium]